MPGQPLKLLTRLLGLAYPSPETFLSLRGFLQKPELLE